MPARATPAGKRNQVTITAQSAVTVNEVFQLPGGLAAYLSGSQGKSSGSRATFETDGQVIVPKTAGVVLLDGGPVFWDHSASTATFRQVSDRDFFIGQAVGDAASDDASCTVNLNVRPAYKIDLLRDPCLSTPVGTIAAGGFGYPLLLGGSAVLELTATNEAQKVDLMSRDGFAVNANAIIEGAFLILNDGANATQDFTIGIASGTHATDFQSVAEFVAVSTVGNSTNINAQSDDGTTDVAPTDTTADYTEGSDVAKRVEFWIDTRNPADAQVYVNGANVLPNTTFSLAAATGPLYLIAHLEKTSGTDVYKVAVDWLRARISQQ